MTVGDYSLEMYSYSVDLTNIKDDKARVALDCPGLDQESHFSFPKTIPGTYKELDYGEMIDSINAYDSEGLKLPATKIGKNYFEISNAKDLSRINYWLDDTWDHPKAMTRICRMGGTNIEDSANFVIAASGWFWFL